MIFFFADKPDLTIPAIAKCLDHLRNKKDLVPGHTEEIGDGIRCIISAYDTVDESQAFWEAHRRYVDMHCIIHGEERVSVCSLVEAQVGPYHPERDYLETIGIPMVDIQVTAGTVLCLFPNDVHRTRVKGNHNGSGRLLKMIYKIPIDSIDVKSSDSLHG